MKKLSLLILLLLFVFKVNAQNCDFTYTVLPGTTLVTFTPNPNFPPAVYHYLWDFGDGQVDSSVSPTHAYNSMFPIIACYNVYDANNTLICQACDTLSFHSTGNCTYSVSLLSGNTYIFTSSGTTGNVNWDFGDGGSLTGAVVTYTYPISGTFLACMSDVDPGTGAILCSFCSNITVGNTSNCNFTFGVSPTNPMTVDFVSSAVFGSTVDWDFGDNTVGTGSQVHHTYSVAGTYNVCITVVDPNGGTCTSCQVVTVGNTHGNCYFSYVPDMSMLNTYNFTGSPLNNSSTLTWDFGDGSSGSGINPSHTYAANGSYMVCMTETDTAGVVVCSSCDVLLVGSNTGCTIAATPDILNPLTIDFQVNSGFNTTVTWDFGDNSSGTGSSVSHTYNHAGNYNVCVTIGINGAVVCHTCTFVTVGNNTGNCSITFVPQSPLSTTIDFTAYQSNITSVINWDFGDGSTATGLTATHTFATSGQYNVCITEVDPSNGVILCQTCVVVGGGHNICQASFLATSLGLTSYFIDLSVGNTNATTYSWDFGDGGTSTTRFPQHTYALPGTYTVCLTVTSSNCIDQFCSPVIVDSTNIIPLACQAFFAIVQLAPYEVTVVNLSSGLNLSFLWDFGDGTSDTQPYPSHYYASTGTYNLCLTVTDANGCTSSYCDSLGVDTIGNIFRSRAGFMLNIVAPSQLTAGINDVQAHKVFDVFPNPVSSDLHILIPPGKESGSAYKVLSLQGSEVVSGSLNGYEGTVNTQSLSAGTYLLEVTFSDGSRSYQSIIKN